jgi:hypothetical protein
MMAWGQVGVYMPHNSEAQIAMFPRVPMNALQPGDIVWFPHVGIYAGGGAVINATHTGDFARIHDVSSTRPPPAPLSSPPSVVLRRPARAHLRTRQASYRSFRPSVVT